MNKIIFIIALILSTNIQAQRFIAKNGNILFFSKAPIEDISAQNNKVSAVYDSDTKDLVFQLSIIDFVFPNSLMQEHFNENFLESDIYPKSTFSGKVIAQGLENTIVEGDLKIHGKTNKIKVEGSLKKENNTINILANFIVKLDDYDIKIPRLFFKNIAKDIDVEVNIQLKEIK